MTESDRKYYVYEWYNVDTGHVFYVGKGTGDRYKKVSQGSRNKFFVRYYNAHHCDVRIIANNLTEMEAYNQEHETILKYKQSNECECNFDEGGRPGGTNYGEANGMYHKHHTPEVCEMLRKLNSDGRHKGANNSQYGKSFYDRMSPETLQKWLDNHRQGKISKGKNGRAQKVVLLNLQKEPIQTFDCIIECAAFLIEQEHINTTIENMRSRIKYGFTHPKSPVLNKYYVVKSTQENTVPSSNHGEG